MQDLNARGSGDNRRSVGVTVIGCLLFFNIPRRVGHMKKRSFHAVKKEIGFKVLELHGHKCTKCGSTEKLCIHHIEPMKPDNPRYNDIENLTVLCNPCHMSHHRKAGDIVGYGVYVRKKIYCSVDGCDRIQHAKQLCKMHYLRMDRKRKRWSNPARLGLIFRSMK